MIPSRTVSANCPALHPVIWPKYCSFSFATLPINSYSRPNSVNIESFVRCSCHEMLSIFLQHHISKASILFLSDFFYSVAVHLDNIAMDQLDETWLVTSHHVPDMSAIMRLPWQRPLPGNGALDIQQLWASEARTREPILMKVGIQQQIRTTTTVI